MAKIVAPLVAIPGIGPARAEAIIKWREEVIGNGQIDVDEDSLGLEWEDLKEIHGIGPKMIATIQNFCEAEDPFGVGETARVLNEIRNGIANGRFPGIPTPTHISLDIPKTKELVCFVGVVRKRKYYDAAEQMCKRTVDLSYEEALEKLEDRHLLKYAALYCIDEYDEEVIIRISRWKYPNYTDLIRKIKIDRDIVVVEGYSSDFQGASIQAKRLVVFEP